MKFPWLPPYLGSWHELIEALLHDPFLGGGTKPGPHHWAFRMFDPEPSPWRPDLVAWDPQPSPWSPAVSFLVSAISLKDLASKLPDAKLRKELDTQAGRTISTFIDEYCGTPTRFPRPWPWPGPPPWVYSIASELVLSANLLQEGSLRNEFLQVASEIVQKASSVGVGHLQQE